MSGEKSPWEKEGHELVMRALEWERLRRGMPGSTPETIAKAEAKFWEQCTLLQNIKVQMLTEAIEKSRRESPDGKDSWDRVEDYRIEHGHLPGDKEAEKKCAKCNPKPADAKEGM